MRGARGRSLLAATVVAIAAMGLTARVRAETPPTTAESAGPPAATPLALRPKPLELAHDPPQSGLGWKVVALMALLGGGAYYLRKRARPARVDDGRLVIVRRTSIGLRSELLVVNVEGQRLLLGVTPHSIQSLAVLDGDEAAAMAPSDAALAEGSSVGERFAAMLQAADSRPQAGRADTSAADDAVLQGQARGLLALRRRG